MDDCQIDFNIGDIYRVLIIEAKVKGARRIFTLPWDVQHCL